MRRFRVVVAGCALSLIVAACGSSASTTTAPKATTVPVPGATSPTGTTAVDQPRAMPSAVGVETTVAAPTLAVAASVLNFSTTRVGGGTVNGADYAGKPVAFWFWAPT